MFTKYLGVFMIVNSEKGVIIKNLSKKIINVIMQLTSRQVLIANECVYLN